MYELAYMFAIIIACLVILIAFTLTAMLRPSPKKKPRYIESFEARTSPEQVLKAIVYFALKSGMDIEYFDENELRITLGDRVTIWNLGFFYPIYLSLNENGKTLVEVGVKGKASVTGTVAFRYRDKVVNGIKAVMFIKHNIKEG